LDKTLTILYEEKQEEPEPSCGTPIPPAYIIAGVLAAALAMAKMNRRL